MGYRDASSEPASAEMTDLDYETRELAWELSQPRVDGTRVRFLMETGASLPRALEAAHLRPADVLKNPQLRHLQLQRHLGGQPSL